VFEALDVGIEFADVVLEPLDPALLLGNALTTFPLAVVNKLCKVIGQLLVFLVASVGKGGADDADDGQGEGLHMYGWPCRSM